MSTGGIFTLITNDGKQDEMLLAKKMLRDRLRDIRTKKIARGMRDTDPTIDDIEETHYFPLVGHFKPLAALAQEYQQLTPQSQIAWGAEISVPILQFGELLVDAVALVSIGSISASNAAFWNTPGGNPVGAELISYVNHPGHAIFSRVILEVNGNILDEYGPDVMNFFYKFYITTDKKVAWDRLVGQELPIQGYAPVVSSGLQTGFYRNAGVRQVVSYVNGPQTPKATQPALNLAVPLLFWFNLDPSKAIPSVAIPYGQRFYKFKMNSVANLMQQHHAYNISLDNPTANPIQTQPTLNLVVMQNNIFVDPEIHDILLRRIGFYKVNPHRYQRQIESMATGRELLSNLKWPIETIYIGFQPLTNPTSAIKGDTWNQYAQPTLVNINNSSLSNGYRWTFATQVPPVTANITAAQYDASFAAYTGNTISFETTLGAPVVAGTVLTVNQVNSGLTLNGYPPLNASTFVNVNTPTAAEIIAATPNVYHPSYIITYTPTISTLYYTAQSINLTPNIASTFYSDYETWTFINDHMRTSEDVGVYMYSFALFTDVNQPSGYINVSRSREFYVNWTSSYISPTNQVEMVVVAVSINFLLISDGSAVLRYAT